MINHAQRELDTIAPGTTPRVYEVPGAYEIPLAVQMLASRGGLDAIIALGVIIEGETDHARLIGTAVTESLQRISLNHQIPIIHEVLLVKNQEQARARCLEDEINRGTEAARVAIRMTQFMAEITRR